MSDSSESDDMALIFDSSESSTEEIRTPSPDSRSNGEIKYREDASHFDADDEELSEDIPSDSLLSESSSSLNAVADRRPFKCSGSLNAVAKSSDKQEMRRIVKLDRNIAHEMTQDESSSPETEMPNKRHYQTTKYYFFAENKQRLLKAANELVSMVENKKPQTSYSSGKTSEDIYPDRCANSNHLACMTLDEAQAFVRNRFRSQNSSAEKLEEKRRLVLSQIEDSSKRKKTSDLNDRRKRALSSTSSTEDNTVPSCIAEKEAFKGRPVRKRHQICQLREADPNPVFSTFVLSPDQGDCDRKEIEKSFSESLNPLLNSNSRPYHIVKPVSKSVTFALENDKTGFPSENNSIDMGQSEIPQYLNSDIPTSVSTKEKHKTLDFSKQRTAARSLLKRKITCCSDENVLDEFGALSLSDKYESKAKEAKIVITESSWKRHESDKRRIGCKRQSLDFRIPTKLSLGAESSTASERTAARHEVKFQLFGTVDEANVSKEDSCAQLRTSEIEQVTSNEMQSNSVQIPLEEDLDASVVMNYSSECSENDKENLALESDPSSTEESTVRYCKWESRSGSFKWFYNGSPTGSSAYELCETEQLLHTHSSSFHDHKENSDQLKPEVGLDRPLGYPLNSVAKQIESLDSHQEKRTDLELEELKTKMLEWLRTERLRFPVCCLKGVEATIEKELTKCSKDSMDSYSLENVSDMSPVSHSSQENDSSDCKHKPGEDSCSEGKTLLLSDFFSAVEVQLDVSLSNVENGEAEITVPHHRKHEENLRGNDLPFFPVISHGDRFQRNQFSSNDEEGSEQKEKDEGKLSDEAKCKQRVDITSPDLRSADKLGKDEVSGIFILNSEEDGNAICRRPFLVKEFVRRNRCEDSSSHRPRISSKAATKKLDVSNLSDHSDKTDNRMVATGICEERYSSSTEKINQSEILDGIVFPDAISAIQETIVRTLGHMRIRSLLGDELDYLSYFHQLGGLLYVRFTELVKSILTEMGIEEPTTFQKFVSRVALCTNHRRIIALSSKTGRKTAVFLLLALMTIDTANDRVQAIIVCPNVEKMITLYESIQRVTKWKMTIGLIGGTCPEAEKLLLKPIWICIPNALKEMHDRNFDLGRIQMLIIDDVDDIDKDDLQICSDSVRKLSNETKVILFGHDPYFRMKDVSENYSLIVPQATILRLFEPKSLAVHYVLSETGDAQIAFLLCLRLLLKELGMKMVALISPEQLQSFSHIMIPMAYIVTETQDDDTRKRVIDRFLGSIQRHILITTLPLLTPFLGHVHAVVIYHYFNEDDSDVTDYSNTIANIHRLIEGPGMLINVFRSSKQAARWKMVKRYF